MIDTLVTLLTLFMLLIVPLWLFLHYRYYTRLHAGRLAEQERLRLEQVAQQAEQLHNRLLVLEKILDEFDPQWRQRS